eukprot:jgi/Botrbrau1/8682/Bobra.0087s0035.1
MPSPNDDAQKAIEISGAKVQEVADNAAKAVAQEGGKQVDFLKEYLNVDSLQDVREGIWKATEAGQKAAEDTLSAAAKAVKSGAATASEQYEQAYARGQTLLDTAVAHTQALEEQIFGKVKEGVDYAMDNKALTYTVLGVAAFVILPGPRRFLFRNTIGRFRSEEAMYKSAEVRAKALAQAVEEQNAEAGKLDLRLAAAIEQWETGRSKVRATARQLQSLQKQARSTEKSGQSLIGLLRELPSKQALALRSEVAKEVAAARAQRSALDKQLWSLTKKGF